ncbi:L-arabinose transporter ATP-binding protein [Escherichia coli]|nr:L-arabinose transporter ATP-binding protein [Escherichia coli]
MDVMSKPLPICRQVDHDALVQAMVGRDIGDIYGWQPRSYGEERLRLDAVKAPGVRTPISLAVRSGEIVGLFGLVGAGRSELMKGLFWRDANHRRSGLYRPTADRYS